MDPNGAQEIVVSESLSESHSQALDDFSGVGSGDVDAQDLLVGARDRTWAGAENDLGHAGGALVIIVSHSPLQWLEAGHHTVHILRTVPGGEGRGGGRMRGGRAMRREAHLAMAASSVSPTVPSSRGVKTVVAILE
jgi:hypothetical protein